jgi:hypothetical protein
MANHRGTSDSPASSDIDEEAQPPFNWRRAWWGAAIGVAVAIFGQFMGGSSWWWLAVPACGIFGGLPFGGKNPNYGA